MGSPSCLLSIHGVTLVFAFNPSRLVLVAVLLFHFGVTNSLQLPSCHDEESSALLQFKQSFSVINESDPILPSWKPPVEGENSTCCSWEGVECVKKTGHVIGLDLSFMGLYGSINSNSTLFHLVHLESLNLAQNDFSSSQIPTTIRNLSKLRYLDLSSSNFSGQAPTEISQLSKLISLDLSGNDQVFSNERFLSSLAQNLTRLEELTLSYMNVPSTLPDTITNLSHLTSLILYGCGLFGKIPYSLGNLTHLTYLVLSSNQLSGILPSSLGNLARLTELWLSGNKFSGSIPDSLFDLINLRICNLGMNNLTGTVEFHKFGRLQNLTDLNLASNKLEVLSESRPFHNATTSFPKFEYLGLGWCNLKEFPSFLRFQVTLLYLDLSGNNLQGQVPNWIWNTSTQAPMGLNMSHNFLSSISQSLTILPLVNLDWLDLSFNMISESLLLPSTSIKYYNIANNMVTGQVSPMICNLTDLQYLDLSNNKLTGELPKCVGMFGIELEYLNLGNNSFHGVFPQSSFTNGSCLSVLDISHNNFHGQLPRSLANCASLQILVLSYNQFNDTFPVWLGDLPQLKILTMDHNVFHGMIVRPNKKSFHFPLMRILDLSYNYFSSEFPFEYILSGNGTKSITVGNYYGQIVDGVRGMSHLYYSITIMSKGVARYYSKIQEGLILIDISSNKFEGRIPEFIGKLKGIWSLNMSNNILTGSIPSSLSNLSRLEALDLSHNKLFGEIPQQLAQLDFLTKFNVSYNNLTGPVPRGIHFTTFDITSYQGNQGLCGDLLPKKCGDSEPPQLPPLTSGDNDSSSRIELDWKFVAAGSGSGLLVGVVLADLVITKWSARFIEVVAVLIRLTKRMRRIRNLIH